MARQADLTILAGLSVCLRDPHDPWQRGTNENTNGLLHQYIPKGPDPGKHSSDNPESVAVALNGRSRKTLGWRTPAEAMGEFTVMAQDRGVAATG